MKNKANRKSDITILKEAAKLATKDAKRENKALGLQVLVAKKSGLYLTEPGKKMKLVKKGNYAPVKIKRRTFKLA